MGALAFFGEKYGDMVRVVKFGDSIELCGGTHVAATGQIGYFKILSESAIAAGVRRIEATTGLAAEEFVQQKLETEQAIWTLLKNPKDLLKGVQSLIDENKKLQKQTESLSRKLSDGLIRELQDAAIEKGGTQIIVAKVGAATEVVKNMAFSLIRNNKNVVAILGNAADNKAFLTVAIGEEAIKNKGLHAGNMIRELAKEIKGGGGGQPHFATAGGKDPAGIQSALDKAVDLV